MKPWIVLLACLYVLLSFALVSATPRGTIIFRDDFDAPGPAPPDPAKWIVNHPNAPDPWWWTQGRTHFPNPTPDPGSGWAGWVATGEFPRVENGVCVIEHHLYNPYESAAQNTTFLGGEIRTALNFEPNTSYCFEARVRLSSDLPYVPYPNGLVTSVFTFGFDGSNSDETDFEFLSNKMNDDVTYPDGDPVLTNPWNESQECPEYVIPAGLNLTQWNTFRIYWYPQPDAKCPNGGCLEWTWLDPVAGETLLRRAEANTACIPDEPMALYFNFWAPAATWGDAYDASLQPVDNASGNEISAYEIDYVEVRAPASIPTISEWGLAIMTLLVLCAGTIVLIRRETGDGTVGARMP